MNRLLCAASIVALMLPGIAGAQQQQQQDTKHQHGQSAKPAHQGQRPDRRPHNGQPTIQPVPNRPARPPHNGRPTIQPVPSRPTRPPHNGRPTIQPVRPGRPHHVRPIRGPVFHYPRGYHYRRWSIGLVLPRVFLSSPYYWTNWSQFGLYPPPHNYRWVRYGPDLLLVNIYTGRIRDVVYNAFY